MLSPRCPGPLPVLAMNHCQLPLATCCSYNLFVLICTLPHNTHVGHKQVLCSTSEKTKLQVPGHGAQGKGVKKREEWGGLCHVSIVFPCPVPTVYSSSFSRASACLANSSNGNIKEEGLPYSLSLSLSWKDS